MIILTIITFALFLLVGYSCLVVAGKADEKAEIYERHAEYLEKGYLEGKNECKSVDEGKKEKYNSRT